jgi:hypothetical protein
VIEGFPARIARKDIAVEPTHFVLRRVAIRRQHKPLDGHPA